MYTLYGTDDSGSCMIEIALQRCAVPWHRVDASSWQDGEGSEALARINPLKQIPTLETTDLLQLHQLINQHMGLELLLVYNDRSRGNSRIDREDTV
ncbi:hypothetical protein L9Z73_22870, partial [Pseudomonas sp. TNT11]|nr:hypothetical protein [Pseudomonas emilianonis]